MATFFVLTDNSSYRTKNEMVDMATAKDALELGVRAAISIAGDEIAEGARTAVVEVSVQDRLTAELLRSAVMISVAPLVVREGVNER